ncbi:MAG: GNAT family N-acetyltransferase [Chloroflexi bacterium]|nr:MAG: GNAT family N-acetyltransferase [Chloroflexota bacterium]
MTQLLTTERGEILIREAKPADAVQFRELRLGALQDSPIAFTADYQKNLSHSLKYWEDMLTMQADESTIFLAEHKSKLIGMTGIARGSSPKTRHGAWIWGVYVKPEWRGLHIAEEFINACCAWAKARKIVLAKLGVAAVNQPAIRCYERCGFKTYGTEPHAIFYEGKYYDEYLMVVNLNDKQNHR